MTEIFQLVQLFFIFCLFLLAPFNLLKKKFFNYELTQSSIISYNIIFNLNVLLIFSLLPLKIDFYYLYFLTALILLIIKNYFFELKELKIKIHLISIIIFFIIFLIISIDIASKLNLGWDAKWFWFIKSLYFYENKTLGDLSNFTLNDFHPHFGSFIWAFFRKISFLNYEYYGRLFYAFFYIFSLFFITKDLFKNKNLNLLIFLILIIITYKYNYFSGLQEILLFSLLLLISKSIFDFIDSRKFSDLIFISLCLNLLLWIKAEGIAYFLIILVGINFIKIFKINDKIKFNLINLLLILFKYSFYKLLVIETNNQPYYLDYLLNLNLDILIYKIYNISIFFIYNSFSNFIIILTFIIMLFSFKKLLTNMYFKNILIIFLLNICFIYSCYIFRDMEVVYSLRTTIDRIMFTSTGFYFYFTLVYLKKLTSSFLK